MENEKNELLNYIEETEQERTQSIEMMKSYEEEISTLKSQIKEFESEREQYIQTKRQAESKIQEFQAEEENLKSQIRLLKEKNDSDKEDRVWNLQSNL